MKIIAKCMIRSKPDSYCQSQDVETRGISDLVNDLIELLGHSVREEPVEAVGELAVVPELPVAAGRESLP